MRKRLDKSTIIGGLPFWIAFCLMVATLTYWIIDDPTPFRILAAIVAITMGAFIFATGGVALADYFRRTADYRGTIVGGSVGFWFGVLILAKLLDMRAQGFIHYISKTDNVFQGMALIGFGTLFGVVFGALFDKPSIENEPQDSKQ